MAFAKKGQSIKIGRSPANDDCDISRGSRSCPHVLPPITRRDIIDLSQVASLNETVTVCDFAGHRYTLSKNDNEIRVVSDGSIYTTFQIVNENSVFG